MTKTAEQLYSLGLHIPIYPILGSVPAGSVKHSNIFLFEVTNFTVVLYQFHDVSSTIKKVNSISHVSDTTTVNKTICQQHLWYQLKRSLTKKHTKISIFRGKCLFAKISRLTISCRLTLFLISKKCQFPF